MLCRVAFRRNRGPTRRGFPVILRPWRGIDERCPICGQDRRTPARGARGPPARGRRAPAARGARPEADRDRPPRLRGPAASRSRRRLRGRALRARSRRAADGRRARMRAGRRAEPRLRGRPVGTTRELRGSHRRHRPRARRPQAAATAHPPASDLRADEVTTRDRRPRHDTRSDHPRPGGDPSAGAPRERPRPKRDPRADRLSLPRCPGRAHRPPRSEQAPGNPTPRTTPGTQPHPQRPRDPLPPALPRPRPAQRPRVNTTSHGKEVDFLFEAPTAHRRDRLLALPPHPPRLRGGPRERRPHDEGRLPHAAVHRPPAHRGPDERRGRHPRPPRRPPRRVAWNAETPVPENEDLAYTIRRSPRARRIRVRVDPHDGIEVVIPQRATKREARAAVAELRPWIDRRLAEAERARTSLAVPRRHRAVPRRPPAPAPRRAAAPARTASGDVLHPRRPRTPGRRSSAGTARGPQARSSRGWTPRRPRSAARTPRSPSATSAPAGASARRPAR